MPQTFIGVNEMTSVLDEEVKKQEGAFNYDLFELKIDFSSELESFGSANNISSIVCFSILSKCSLSDLRMSEISDTNFFFFL
jgi:hypothetical protein